MELVHSSRQNRFLKPLQLKCFAVPRDTEQGYCHPSEHQTILSNFHYQNFVFSPAEIQELRDGKKPMQVTSQPWKSELQKPGKKRVSHSQSATQGSQVQ